MNKTEKPFLFYLDKLILYSFYSLFFLTPLLMSSVTSELFEFNKMIFIYLITVLIVFIWILKMILLKKIILKKTILDIPIIIFLCSQILSTIFSIDRHTSLYGYYGRFNGGLISIIAYVLLFYLFVANINREHVEKTLKISLISSFLVILWGLPGKMGHDLSCLLFLGQFNNNCWTNQFRPAERMFSTLGQPNWLGAYLAINFFIGLYFFITEKKSIKYLIYLFLVYSSILFTRSRSALAAIFIGIIPLSIYIYQEKKILAKFIKSLKYLFIFFIIATVIFKTGVGKIDKIIDPKTYSNLFAKKEVVGNKAIANPTPINVTESFDIRKIVWEGAIELSKKYPILGTGVETFAYSYYFVRPQAHNLTSEWDYLYNKAHNEFLNYLATTGYLGLISYLAMVIILLYVFLTKKEEKLFYFAILGAYISISITNFFGFSTSTINIFFYLIPAMIFVYEKKETNLPDKYDVPVRWQKILAVSASIIFLFFTVSIFKYWFADYYYAEGDKYYKGGYYEASIQYFQKALGLKYEHVYEDKLAYSLANLASSYYMNKQNTQTEEIMKMAEYYNARSIKASSKNALYWKTRAKIYYIFFLIDSNNINLNTSLESLTVANKIAPTDPKIPLFKGQFYSLLAEEEKENLKKQEYLRLSFEEINKALELKADYQDALSFKKQLEEKY